MTLAELRARWMHRSEEWSRLGISVDGAKLAAEVLVDLTALHQSQTIEAVTLKEASLIGGYSIDHLQRLVASRQIENVGRKGRPRIRRADVPTRPGYRLPDAPDDDQFSARRRIVASVATGHTEAS